MSTKGKIYSALVLVIVVSFAGGYVAFREESARNRVLTSEVVATIEDVKVRREVDPVFGGERTIDISVTYSYSIDGIEYGRTTRMPRLYADVFVPWKTGKVCYDPSDPKTIKEGKLFPPSHACGDE